MPLVPKGVSSLLAHAGEDNIFLSKQGTTDRDLPCGVLPLVPEGVQQHVGPEHQLAEAVALQLSHSRLRRGDVGQQVAPWLVVRICPQCHEHYLRQEEVQEVKISDIPLLGVITICCSPSGWRHGWWYASACSATSTTCFRPNFQNSRFCSTLPALRPVTISKQRHEHHLR